jgi:cell division protein DivIC
LYNRVPPETLLLKNESPKGLILFLCIILTSLFLPRIFYMSILKKIFPVIINRYFLVLVGFVVWMLFFDQRDYFLQRERKAELEKLEAAKKYYQEEINLTQKQLENLQSNPAAVEKYARERYLLRREGEEVYLFEDSAETNTEKPQ